MKDQLTKAAAIGVAAGTADLLSTTGWMHRSYTHGAWRLPNEVELAARTALWQGTGIRPRVWAAVHRIHHDKADTEGDPHSPIMQGRHGVLKLFLRNVSLYRKAAAQVKDEQLPSDLQPDRLDKAVFDKPKMGLVANIAGHIAINKALGNPAYMAAFSFGIEKGVYIFGGNAVNSIGHAGKHPLKAVVTGTIEPHEDGTYGSDSSLVGTVTFGEGMQKYHHEHPDSVFFGPENLSKPRQLLRDPMGAVALMLIDAGLAEKGHPPADAA